MLLHGDSVVDWHRLTFADHAGRLYARRYGMAPMVGRLLGYLAICDPRQQSVTPRAMLLRRDRDRGDHDCGDYCGVRWQAE